MMWIEKGRVRKGLGVEPFATVLGLGSCCEEMLKLDLGFLSTEGNRAGCTCTLWVSSGNLADHGELVPLSCVWRESLSFWMGGAL